MENCVDFRIGKKIFKVFYFSLFCDFDEQTKFLCNLFRKNASFHNRTSMSYNTPTRILL